MAEAVTSITASTYSVSTGLGINYIGEHCYAYGGKNIVTAATTPRIFMEFTTGSGYIHAKFFFGYDTTGAASGNEIGYEIFLNDISILDNTGLYGHGWSLTGSSPPELILPPFTKVRVQMETDDTGGLILNAFMTGRVYGVD